MAVVLGAGEMDTRTGSDYDQVKELKEFDETKAGAKGLVDSGVVRIPRFFIHPQENLPKAADTTSTTLQVPLIDLEGVDSDRRMVVVDEIRKASETWGLFQIVNHGIPIGILKEMLEGVRRFHEQPKEVKAELYSRDSKRKVKYYCNGNLYESKAVSWRDTLSCDFCDDAVNSEALPPVCREITVEYGKCIINVKEIMSELLSEALGLDHNYLRRMECMKSQVLLSQYYPICPEPDLTLGAPKHSDPGFLTIVLQDHIGGLQVLHKHQWFDVCPTQGALIVNIGDLLQLITNDKFKRAVHRVLVGCVGPRTSVACFSYPSSTNESRPYGPIEELLSDDNPPTYRSTLFGEYLARYKSEGINENSTLPLFKLGQIGSSEDREC